MNICINQIHGTKQYGLTVNSLLPWRNVTVVNTIITLNSYTIFIRNHRKFSEVFFRQ